MANMMMLLVNLPQKRHNAKTAPDPAAALAPALCAARAPPAAKADLMPLHLHLLHLQHVLHLLHLLHLLPLLHIMLRCKNKPKAVS